MDEFIKQCMEEGPYPYPLENIKDDIEVCFSHRMMVLDNRAKTDFPAGVHQHSSYEFIVPFYRSLPARVGNLHMLVEKNKVFPLNSEQLHGPSQPISGIRLLAIQLEKDFLNEISRMLFSNSEMVVFENRCFDYNPDLQNLIRVFKKEFHSRRTGHQFVLQCISSQVAVLLLRNLKSNVSAAAGRSYSEKEKINRAVEYLEEFYDRQYSLEEVARVANLSPYHFIKVFKTHTGKTPYEYLVGLKIEKARKLLSIGDRTITEVCFTCGFSNTSHFTKTFKKMVGVSPSVYRKLLVYQ